MGVSTAWALPGSTQGVIMELRYGTNPHQRARLTVTGEDPFRIVAGQPSYINVLDAVNGWALVRDASEATGLVAATSFKHVSPAGVAVDGKVDAATSECWQLEATTSAALRAYARARDGDPKSSFGDFIAISDEVDHELAQFLMGVVADGIIAPSFAPGTTKLLSTKKRGSFLILEADSHVRPPGWERREVGGVVLEQEVDAAPIGRGLLQLVQGGDLTEQNEVDALVGMITARYTQSNTVVYVRDGVTLGIGAGQQSRVDCTQLAGAKADAWWMRRHPVVRSCTDLSMRRQERINLQMLLASGRARPADKRLLDEYHPGASERLDAESAAWMSGLSDVVVTHDGYIPFRDNIDEAALHGVSVVVEPGGSARTDEVGEACSEHEISWIRTGLRLFHH